MLAQGGHKCGSRNICLELDLVKLLLVVLLITVPTEVGTFMRTYFNNVTGDNVLPKTEAHFYFVTFPTKF